MLPIANAIEEIAGRRSAVAAGRPADARRSRRCLRGLVASWPVARAGRESAAATDAYLRRFYQGRDRQRDARRAGHRRPASSTTTTSAASISSRCASSWTRCSTKSRATSKSEIRRRSMSARRRSTRACRAFAPRTISTLGESPAAREHLAGQSHAHRRPSRSAGQHRVRRRGAPPLHAVPARTAGEPLHRSARLHACRPGDQPGRFRAAGFREIPEVRRSAAARAGRRARPGRCDLHSQHVVASHRVARQPQRAGELLVAPVAGVHGLADERAHARDPDCARSAAGAAQGLAEPVPALRLRGGRAHGRPHSAASPPRAWRRWIPNRRASCEHDCCRD